MPKKVLSPEEKAAQKEQQELKRKEQELIETRQMISVLKDPNRYRRTTIVSLLDREAKGLLPDIDDLLVLMRHSYEFRELQEEVLNRVGARSRQLTSNHYHLFTRVCRGTVGEWAEKHRAYFGKKDEPRDVQAPRLEAIPA